MRHGRLASLVLAAIVAGVGCGSEDATAGSTTVPSVPSERVTATSAPPPAPELLEPVTPSTACEGLRAGRPSPVRGAVPMPEISGAVVSDRVDPGLWVHEDSGNDAVLVELAFDGVERARWVVPGVVNLDWEDLAAAVSLDGQRHLFIGDVGDNRRVRTHVQVLRIPEPPAEEHPAQTAVPAVIELVLPDGPADVEALIVDPHTGDIVLLTKEITGIAQVLVAPAAAWTADGSRLEMVGAGSLSLGPGQAALAADVSPDGTLIAVRTPFRVLLWDHIPGRSVFDTLLAETPCRGPAVFDPLGEALALLDDGYVLVGESDQPELIRVGP